MNYSTSSFSSSITRKLRSCAALHGYRNEDFSGKFAIAFKGFSHFNPEKGSDVVD